MTNQQIGGTVYCEKCGEEIYPDKVCQCQVTNQQKDVEEISAEILSPFMRIYGWAGEINISPLACQELKSAISAALQAERDRAESTEAHVGLYLHQMQALRTRAENAEHVAKIAQQAAIQRIEEVNGHFDALLARTEKAERELSEANRLLRIVAKDQLGHSPEVDSFFSRHPQPQ